MIYSASSVTATVREGASWHYLARQLVFIGMSAPIAWFLSDSTTAGSGTHLGFFGSAAWPARGDASSGYRARRCATLDTAGAVQPAALELAKIACVLLVASIAIEWMQRKTPTNTFLGRVGMAVGVPALVMLQPDFGTTLTLIASVGFVLILAGIDWSGSWAPS